MQASFLINLFLEVPFDLYHAPLPQFFAGRLEMKCLKADWTVKSWGYCDDFVMVVVAAIY